MDQTQSIYNGSPLALRFQAYRYGERALLELVFRERIKQDPALGKMAILPSDHKGPIRSVGGSNPFDVPFRDGSAELALSYDAIESLDLDAFAATTVSGADQMVAALGRMMFGTMTEMVRHVGNDVDGSGKTLFEQFKEGILRVELSFGENGTVELPTLFVPPGREDEAKAAMDEVFRDGEVIASINERRRLYFSSRPKRRLWPC